MSAIPLGSKLGAAFLGNIFASIFYGVTCVQTYLYSRRSRKDGPWFRATIFFLWIMDSLQLAFVTHGLYYYMISNFGNLLALLKPTWSLFAQIYVTCVMELIVRCIFGRRVWLMTGSYIISGLIAVTTILTFVAGFLFASRAIEGKTFANFDKISSFLYLALGSGVAVDLLVAGTLCINLFRRRTGFKKTDSLLTKLIAYTINTSLLTTVCSTACFITYAIWPDEFTFMGIYFVLNKLFFNCLLAILNSRGTLAESLGGVSNVSGLSNIDTSDHSNHKQAGARNGPSQLVISINRETMEEYEMNDKSLGYMGTTH